MAAKQRSDLEFEVVYSIHLEKMMVTLLGRVDKLFSFLQILMGVAVVSNLWPTFVGLVVAAIATAQLVWQPGVKAIEAKSSHDRWHAVFNKLVNLNDNQLRKEIEQLSDRDSHALSSLCLVAHTSAATQLNLPISGLPAMKKWQKVVAFCAGAI